MNIQTKEWHWQQLPSEGLLKRTEELLISLLPGSGASQPAAGELNSHTESIQGIFISGHFCNTYVVNAVFIHTNTIHLFIF